MTIELKVPTMSCQHCVNAITNEVSDLPGVERVVIDLGTKKVSVEADARVTTDAVIGAINEAGYDEVSVLN